MHKIIRKRPSSVKKLNPRERERQIERRTEMLKYGRDRRKVNEVTKLIERTPLIPAERVDCGGGYFGTPVRVESTGRVLYWLYSPEGQHLSACWGIERLRNDALSHSTFGVISK
jgi:hypothetical protein